MKRFGVLVAIVTMLFVATFGTTSAFITSLTLDSKADLSASKSSVVVTGTIICSPDMMTTEDADISVVVTQASGQVEVAGSGETTVDCSGTVQVWSATVNVVTGPAFKHGPAVAIFSAFDSSGDDFPTQTKGLKIQ